MNMEKSLLHLLLERQEERKISFIQSGRMPWSREEWRWHEEHQKECERKTKS